MSVHEARAKAARDVQTALASYSGNATLPAVARVPGIAAATIYAQDGTVVTRFARPREPIPFAALAERLAPADVACSTVRNSTLCIESSSAAVAPAVRGALVVIAIATIGATIAGVFGGRLLARRIEARRMTAVLERAARDHAYSLRVDGEGPLAASINELLRQMQERDVELRRRTTELETANKDLEAFAYSVSHDLRAPLGSIDGFSMAIEIDYADRLDDTGRDYLNWIRKGCVQMRDLIDGLLQMSRLSRAEVQREPVDLSAIAQDIAGNLRQKEPARPVEFEIRDGMRTVGDERLLYSVVENLMGNAWKFTRGRSPARIEVGATDGAFYVRDNGAGFDPAYASKMFLPFQRLHSAQEFEGTGIGLATVQKIIERHGGRAWAEGDVEKGATIYFTTV